mmetsp:Transcript_64847/g.130379  ORF Transcript_64847/g.130379 Transcript_64847/m.130379 type:complete len:157 (-) Transcript_64847:359-829(-)
MATWSTYLVDGVPVDRTPDGYDHDNLFAKIIRGEIPSHKVFETEHAVAILDAFPVARFHCLILPKAPSIDVGDLPSDVAAAYLAELPKLVTAVKKASGAPGVKVVSNAGAAAGQVVFHTHFHVIPRYTKTDSMSSAATMVNAEEAVESLRLLHINL